MNENNSKASSFDDENVKNTEDIREGSPSADTDISDCEVSDSENEGEASEKMQYKPSFSSRVENFFYHYKWHTIAALFILIISIVIGLQMCSKDDYDAYILYAGGYSISRKADSDVAEYVKITSALERVTEDFDNNGEKKATLLDLYAPTPEEQLEEGKDSLTNFTLENFSTLEYELFSGSDYYVCFLSEYNYNKYKVWDGVSIFTPLAPYAHGNESLEYYDECAVYLSSTEFYKLEGVSSLPPDTLVCLRALSSVASFFDKRDNKKMFERGEDLIENILSYGN